MKPEISPKFKPFRLSPLTRAVEERLVAAKEGEVVTYSELSEVIKMDCSPDGKGYNYVITALKRLAAAKGSETVGHNFVNIKTVGYRKLTPNETIEDNRTRIKNIGRGIKRVNGRYEALDYQRLGEVEKLEYRAATLFGKIAGRILSENARRKMIEEIKKQPDREAIDYNKLSEKYMRGK